jgi:hypothetical protein
MRCQSITLRRSAPRNRDLRCAKERGERYLAEVKPQRRRQRVRHRRESNAPQQTDALSECRLTERPLHDRLDQRGQGSECEIAAQTP